MHDTAVRVRRPLTPEEIATFLDRVAAAESTSELATTAVATLIDPLLADHGLQLGDLGPTHTVDPTALAMPHTQWQALASAVTSRADEWGTATPVGLALIDRRPSSYDDPATPAPQLILLDRRADLHMVKVSRSAADEITACEQHLTTPANHYGPGSGEYLQALRSRHQGIVRVFDTRNGEATTIGRDGPLGLVITNAGFTFGLVFHRTRRRCATPGCPAVPTEDNGWKTPYAGAPLLDHTHHANYGPDAPEPGRWGVHT